MVPFSPFWPLMKSITYVLSIPIKSSIPTSANVPSPALEFTSDLADLRDTRPINLIFDAPVERFSLN
jgi:hypothetical protein